MVFNSFNFLFFFGIVYSLYVNFNRVWQNRLLLVSSYVFYGYWDWRFAMLLLISTTGDFLLGLRIDQSLNNRIRKRWLIGSLVLNLGILSFFKYFNFFVASTISLFDTLGIHLSAPVLHVVLPVGISFYTFQSMSYTIDVYRRKLPSEKSFLNFAVYVSFFPQLVAGPIERATNMLRQVHAPREITRQKIGSGLSLIFWGLFKKVFIADNCSDIANLAFSNADSHSGLAVFFGVYAFAFQIYADFSGYSDMARGLARLLGFEMMRNFDLPYFSVNPTEFWRRWHISLSTWLRDYLYIGLGGNRNGSFKTYRNLFLTMLLGGLWHGASWHFIFWGMYQGALLIGHRLLSPWLERFNPKGWLAGRIWYWGRVAFMFQMICIGWIFFRANTLGQVGEMLSHIAGDLRWDAEAWSFLGKLAYFVWPLFAVQFVQFKARDLNPLPHVPAWTKAIFAACLVYLLFIHGASSDSFIYFQF